MKRVLVVGAGFAGAVIARELANAGHWVDVIDARPHVAGNAYDYVNEHGILVHKYGPHLFHTNNIEVFEYLRKFTTWVPYLHKVKAMLADGQLVTLPVNRQTKKIVGEDKIVDTFFRPYTRKMWKMDIEELDPSILSRVPVRDDDNELYFPNDSVQVMPVGGYTKMFERMLDHPNINVTVSCAFDKVMEKSYDHTFNSMPIDEYFDECFGPLPYRSIKFHTHNLPIKRVAPVAVVNYTDDRPFTRFTEWKNIPGHGENDAVTTITIEEPCDYRDNKLERYYPVKDVTGENRKRYTQYERLAAENGNITFIGRCGTYQYLDMWIVVAQTLKTAREFIEENKQ